MITLTVEVLLVVLLGIVLMNLFRKHPSTPAPEPLPDLSNLKPADARAGDIISVSGAGDEFSDLDFTADRCTFVQAGSHHWTELSGPYRERRVSMRAGDQLGWRCGSGHPQRRAQALDRRLRAFRARPGRSGRAPEHRRLLRVRQQDLDVSPQPRGAGHRHGLARRLLLLGIPGERWARACSPSARPKASPSSATVYTGVAPGNVTVYRPRSLRPHHEPIVS